jgi:hypothetical protein
VRRSQLALLSALICPALSGQIAFHAAADLGNNGGSATSYTHSYTVGVGTNRVLFVCLIGDTAADDVTSVTYAGTSMTLINKRSEARKSYLFYLINPASGANNIVISASTAHYLLGGAADYSGVKQSPLPDASSTGDTGGGGATLTTTLTTVADNSWTIICGNDSGPWTMGAGSTQRALDATFGIWVMADSNGVITPAGSHSMTLTGGSASVGSMMASFAPAVSGTGIKHRRRIF